MNQYDRLTGASAMLIHPNGPELGLNVVYDIWARTQRPYLGIHGEIVLPCGRVLEPTVNQSQERSPSRWDATLTSPR